MNTAELDAPIGNDDRGEDELVLGRKKYVLRPSYEAIKAFEQGTGKAIVDLIALGNAGRLKLEELGIIAAEMIRAGAKPGDMAANVSADGIGMKIQEQGIIGVFPKLVLVMIDAASGGRTPSGERKAVTETSESLTAE